MGKIKGGRPSVSIVIDMFALRGNSGGNNPRAFEKLLNLPASRGQVREGGGGFAEREKFPLLHTEKRVFSWIEREISPALNPRAEAYQPRVFESS